MIGAQDNFRFYVTIVFHRFSAIGADVSRVTDHVFPARKTDVVPRDSSVECDRCGQMPRIIELDDIQI